MVRARGWPVRVVLTARFPTGALRAELLRRGAVALVERPRSERGWRKVLHTLRWGAA
jgi:hypothetical protein